MLQKRSIDTVTITVGKPGGLGYVCVEVHRVVVARGLGVALGLIRRDLHHLRERRDSGSSFFEFALGLARCHRDYFGSIAPLREAQEGLLADEAADSLQRQTDIEIAGTISLDEYLQQYFNAC